MRLSLEGGVKGPNCFPPQARTLLEPFTEIPCGFPLRRTVQECADGEPQEDHCRARRGRFLTNFLSKRDHVPLLRAEFSTASMLQNEAGADVMSAMKRKWRSIHKSTRWRLYSAAYARRLIRTQIHTHADALAAKKTLK